MNSTTIWFQRKRLFAMAVSATFLLQTVAPAYATVSQLPGIFITPPAVNVLFTLDDSLSMYSDGIPDFRSFDGVPDLSGMPTNEDSNSIQGRISGYARQLPGMWKSGTDYWAPSRYASTNAVARYMRSSSGNPLYYNPKVTYKPWPLASDDKNLFNANANPAAVNIHPTDPSDATFTRNLTARVDVIAGTVDNETNNFWPATYYVYKGTTPLPPADPNNALNVAGTTTWDKIEIKSAALTPTFARAADRTDCTGAVGPSGCSYAQELQNFANWLQYYRSRMLMAKGGVGQAFSKQGDNLRVALTTINTTAGNGIRTGQHMAAFQTTRRSSFFTDLYSIPGSSGGTPLRRAMERAGEYFKTTGVNSPYAAVPTTTETPVYDCRKSFHIFSTDGFWNGSDATGDASDSSNDVFSGSTPQKKPVPPATTGPTYTFGDSIAADPLDNLTGRFTIHPFSDNSTNSSVHTLADVAAYYWRNDLQTSIANNVFTTERDPAFWQHMTTYTVGLGINGTGGVQRASDAQATVPASEPASSPYASFIGQPWLSSQALRDALITNKTALTWTTPSNESASTGDDLIHASMNARGRYYSATDPSTLANGLASALAEATDRPSSLANVTTESTQVRAGTHVYQATYNPAKWSGRFYAFPLLATGVNTTPSNAVWEASNRMPLPANRNIYTWDPTTTVRAGSDFTWAGLTPTQQADLNNDTTLLDFLRGSGAREALNNGPFRDRARYTVGNVTGGVLGDVVNGSPVKGPSAGGGYDRLDSSVNGQASYALYRSVAETPLDAMRNTLFLGANDGMLHAFDLSNGVERFAYVPNSVFSVPRSLTGTEKKLRMLSDPGYTHRFLVDGSPQIGDAFLGTANDITGWRTVLLGSTGAGARSVFALNVTNPTTTAVVAPRVAASAFSKTNVMWEFSEADPDGAGDMGHVFGYPHIARMRGTASDDRWVAIFGNGYDSANGQAVLYILDLKTGAVLWKQAVGTAGGNGLSQPNFIVNAKREVTAIYAGDLKGNLWKFDVDHDAISAWNVAFSGQPLFTTPRTVATVVQQPITVMPEISYHPSGGAMVSFGTGQLFETTDTATSGNINLNTQALYGIWDHPTGTRVTSTSVLVNQSITAAAASSTGLRTTTGNAVDPATRRGWYINLSVATGERVTVNPLQVKSVLLMVANTPEVDPCSSGGTSKIFGLDPVTGGRPAFELFDANGDGVVNASDRGYNVFTLGYAVLSLPTILSNTTTTDDVTKDPTWNNRGQTAAQSGGVELKPDTSRGADCSGRLLVGASDTSIRGTGVNLCSPGRGRISWRQIQ